MDSLCLRTGFNGFNLNPLNSVNSNLESRPNPSMFSAGPLTGRTMSVGVIAVEKGDGGVKTTSSRFTFKHPFRSLLGSKGLAIDDVVLIDDKASKQEKDEELDRCENGSSHSASSSGCGDEKDGICDCEYDDDDENHTVFDRISFSKLLQRVSLTDARLFAQMSFLGNLAYSIPNIKPKYLLKRYGLRYVTSSIEKREQLASADKKEQLASSDSQQPTNQSQETGPKKAMNSEDDKNKGFRIGPLAAFQMATSVASFLNAHTRQIFGSRKGGIDQEILEDGKCDKEHISEMASSFMSNTDSVTAVVAAKEEVKQAVADDLNKISSTPCEWYICDDDKTATRFFFIQGSETLASWQANLLFEPVQFEGLDTVVHRGIYEAAKGIYQQMLPEIHAHLKAHGKSARLRFTGHSLGGSLSLLINLMLLLRGEVLRSSLLPVITFGSPTIMCGGDHLLNKLNLPTSHIQAVTMHRDIVPRAFSCNYPNRVAKLLKTVNKNFRNHACLNNQKILYAPMGELLILQPESSYSPQHDLLPSGRGLYILTSNSDSKTTEQNLQAAKLRFLNSPHPLEILKDRSAYGKGGAIQRDHDMNSYVKCIRSVIRHELSQLRKAERERRQRAWWAHVMPRDIHINRYVVNRHGRFDISGIIRTGSESLRRLSRIVTSKNLHLLVLLIVPARILLIGAFSFIGGFRLR